MACSLVVPVGAALLVAACGLDIVGGPAPATEDAEVPSTGTDGRAPSDTGSTTTTDSGPIETCSSPGLQRHAPWPMMGGCVGHPGRTVFRGPKQKPKVIWSVKVTTRESQIVIGADDTIYIPANTEGVVAFDPDGGRRAFPNAGTGQPNNVTNVPSIGKDGTLYYGAEKDLVAVTKSGVLWRFKTNGEFDNSTLVDDDGTIYAGSFNDTFYALAPDGGTKWERDLKGDVWASAALGKNGAIYVAAAKRLFAMTGDGGPSWEAEVKDDIQSSPVVADDGTVYVGTTGAQLHAFDGADGGAKWLFAARGNFGWQQLPALGQDGTIYVPVGGDLAAVDPNDGGMKWERHMLTTLRTSAVVDGDGDIYVGGDGKMFALDPNGNGRWELALDANANATGFAIGRDGTLYVATNNDTLTAFHE
jgi:outer membrane protein assembly factor BamB